MPTPPATAVRGASAVLPDRELPNALVVLQEGRIAYCGPDDPGRVPPGAELVEVPGCRLFPGMVDLHVHGCHGDDVMVNGPAGLRRMAAWFAARGVTAWLPTTLSAPHSEILAAVRSCVAAAREPGPGAEIVGIHVEGPYINPVRRGAQDPNGIRPPDLGEATELIAAGEGLVRKMTVAPEVPGGLDLVRLLRDHGVAASIGHSDATYDQTLEAIRAGATQATHLFNQMRPFHHREPGLTGACLNEPGLVCELIVDGVHVDPRAVEMALRALTSGDAPRCCLITDGISATGLPEGEHFLGTTPVTVRAGRCTLEDGTLAGSVLTMERGLRNVRGWTGLPLPLLAEMACLLPARLAGCGDRKGSLEAGKDADLVLLDEDLRVRATWCRGVRFDSTISEHAAAASV